MKEAIRKRIGVLKKELSTLQYRKKSLIIKEKLFALSQFQKAKIVLFYISFNKEVDTHDAIGQLLMVKNKKILVPLVDKDNPLLQVSILDNFNDLKKGSFSILEPKKSKMKKFDTKKIDMVIVPGIAFDKKGHRVGYGHGYYDRFLKTLPKNTIKVGLAFDFQIVEKIPHEKHDVSMDLIVTDSGIIDVSAIKVTSSFS